MAGGVLEVGEVAGMKIDGVLANRLYVLPHEESRSFIAKRFARIDRTFDQQAAAAEGRSDRGRP